MAFLQGPKVFSTLDEYQPAVSPEWVSCPVLWELNVVFSHIIDARGWTNCLKLKVLVFLQMVGVLPKEPPTCEICDRQYGQLLERCDRSDRFNRSVHYDFRGSQFGKRNISTRCKAFCNKKRGVAHGTNFQKLHDWPGLMQVYVFMNADWPHSKIKTWMMKAYGTMEKTLEQWIVWCLEFQHVYTWNQGYHVLGWDQPGRIKKLRQISIDETHWQRGGISKNMAPHSKVALTHPTWVWGAVEVGLDGRNQNCVFRIMRSPSQALDGKPRGTSELTRLAWAHLGADNLIVSDGWAATRAVDWGTCLSKH